MFAINHAATALVVKKKYPQTPMWLLLISVQLVELLWVGFNFLGIENVTINDTVSSVADVHLTHMPYSHSVLSTLLITFIAWFVIGKGLNKPEIAIATAIAIASHLLLDLLTHNQDIALTPFVNLHKLGLGLYAIPLLAFVVEMFYGVYCWWVYRGNKLLLVTIVGFNLVNYTFFSSTIAGPEALLANNPLLLTILVFIQIIVTLVLVGIFSRKNEEKTQNSNHPEFKATEKIGYSFSNSRNGW